MCRNRRISIGLHVPLGGVTPANSYCKASGWFISTKSFSCFFLSLSWDAEQHATNGDVACFQWGFYLYVCQDWLIQRSLVLAVWNSQFKLVKLPIQHFTLKEHNCGSTTARSQEAFVGENLKLTTLKWGFVVWAISRMISQETAAPSWVALINFIPINVSCLLNQHVSSIRPEEVRWPRASAFDFCGASATGGPCGAL